ncbi:MAG TPA: FtsQ-type POTRA domain-containing protein [Candidatus Baltobacteraceae bacterium]|nr:FtsQ-type POTRA domain-containing protein [Candidatus Baltobacteraceae bacterium]
MNKSKKRRRVSATRRLRPFWIVIVLVAIVLVGGGAFVLAWPGFAPDDVVVSGNVLVPRAEIVQRARISMHTNMWLQNTGAIARRVETIPDVAVAHVSRVPPATVRVWVRERVPFALVRSGKQSVVVDRDLRILTPQHEVPVLPVFEIGAAADLTPGVFLTQGNAVALRDDYDALLKARVVPARLGFDRWGGLVATMHDGVRVLLGDDGDLEKKLVLVDPILSQVVRNQRRVATVDLRAPNTPVVVYK